jgi:hypothetical protein
MTAVVRQLRRTTPHPAPQPHNLVTEEPSPTIGELGGECHCGRGETIGTCVLTATRLWFRAFHESPAVYHFERVTDWVCVDCLADAALDVANGVIRERMRRTAAAREAQR